jgi:hypothetical protein
MLQTAISNVQSLPQAPTEVRQDGDYLQTTVLIRNESYTTIPYFTHRVPEKAGVNKKCLNQK